MRILWFTNTSSNFYLGNQSTIGGGWISALEEILVSQPEIEELGVGFFNKQDNGKFRKNDVTYYPMMREGRKSSISKFFYNWRHKVGLEEDIKSCIAVINDFKPDVIHVFGTENIYGLLSKYYPDKVVIHLQGLINPYLVAYFPPGISKASLFCYERILRFIKGSGVWHDYKRFVNMAVREEEIFGYGKYFLGRTDWDKAITTLFAPEAEYIYCGEVLRSEFLRSEWRSTKRDVLMLVTTINNNIYKGLDLVLLTANVLCKKTDISFRWDIYGIMSNDLLVRLFERNRGIKFADVNVFFHGPCPSNIIVDALLQADIFVHPSYIDNSPNSVCEAQIIGMPVIATDVGGVESLIENGCTGIMIPANDPYTMAFQIVRLFNNKDIAIKLGQRARIIALKRHDSSIIVNNILKLYHRISK